MLRSDKAITQAARAASFALPLLSPGEGQGREQNRAAFDSEWRINQTLISPSIAMPLSGSHSYRQLRLWPVSLLQGKVCGVETIGEADGRCSIEGLGTAAESSQLYPPVDGAGTGKGRQQTNRKNGGMHGTEELKGKERSETRHLETRWANLGSRPPTHLPL
ncbi:MAG: hypothetical protein J3Q66DRAFT_388979 [Benniella sp.]|nr:MAG: hypothetical protein J3Q66DRAFT_388979 [Benniella sp.]